MLDWGLAIKIACGGFCTVFIILAILWLSLWMTRLMVNKIIEDKNKK